MPSSLDRDLKWQRQMYDDFSLDQTLHSPRYLEKAREEINFLAPILGKPSMKVLDVPCGTGRHSKLLQDLGHEVTGIDLNEACIRRARAFAPGVNFFVADMIHLSRFRGKFDAVVNLFTSFGYFLDPKIDFKVIREFVRCLKPGGQLVVHVVNREALQKNFTPAAWRERNGIEQVLAAKLDRTRWILDSQHIYLNPKTGQGRAYHHKVRLYTKTEMVDMFRSAGLSRIRTFGSLAGDTYRRFESLEPVYVGVV